MGSLGASLLETLGGSQAAQSLAPMGGLEGGEVNPGMKMFGIEQMLGGGIPETGALPQSGGMPQQAVEEAIIKGFKPSKMNFWKYLGDNFLKSQGHAPVFEKKVYNKNMEKAMEGFTQDPLETIRRIGTFDPKTALDLYNQYQDNKRADVAAERTKMLMQERILDRGYSMLGAATPENYPRIRQIVSNYWSSRGIEAPELPEAYDEDALNASRYGAVDVEKQIDDDRLDRNIDSLIESREASARRQDASASNLIETRNRTRSEVERHNRVMENRPRGGGKNRMANKVFKDKSGSLVEFDKTGEFVKVTQPSGRTIYYGFDANGKRVRIGVKEKE